MRYTTYRYNPGTCQYERVKVNAKNIIWYCLGLMITGSCMLAGILLLHDFVINTDLEKNLRKENRALKEHHTILSASLGEIQPTLASLQSKDRILHVKFFGSHPALPVVNAVSTSKEKVLLADPDSFRKIVSSVKETSQELVQISSRSNIYFENALTLEKDDLDLIHSLPTMQPIRSWQPEMLISGFGLRVNPFHKGLYEHVGIDIAVPRGTPVIATASGVIKEIRKSDLQAGYGNYIDIDHGKGLITRYAHLEDIQVNFGKKIHKGDVIGTVGSSGGSVAPHLHYEVIRKGENVDPIYYMIEGLSSEDHHHLTSMSHQQNQSLD
jgi:murein DD-endopeptidase MepM/ murein hydrolase activator NlpD